MTIHIYCAVALSALAPGKKSTNANPDGILHMVSSSHVIHMWMHLNNTKFMFTVHNLHIRIEF